MPPPASQPTRVSARESRQPERFRHGSQQEVRRRLSPGSGKTTVRRWSSGTMFLLTLCFERDVYPGNWPIVVGAS